MEAFRGREKTCVPVALVFFFFFSKRAVLYFKKRRFLTIPPSPMTKKKRSTVQGRRVFQLRQMLLELEQARQPSEERRTECKPCPSVGSSRETNDEQERECSSLLLAFATRHWMKVHVVPVEQREREKRGSYPLPMCVCVYCTVHTVYYSTSLGCFSYFLQT